MIMLFLIISCSSLLSHSYLIFLLSTYINRLKLIVEF